MVKYLNDNSYFQSDIPGMHHRANGPMRIFENGNYSWYSYNEWHRYYGPARFYEYGQWFINGIFVKNDT
jgi:hypothetical protein